MEGTSKRKGRGSSSSSNTSTLSVSLKSPDSKKPKEDSHTNLHAVENGGEQESSDGAVWKATDLTDGYAAKLDQILARMDKFDTIETHFVSIRQDFKEIKESVVEVKSEVLWLKNTLNTISSNTQDLEKSVQYLDSEVEAQKKALEEANKKTQDELERLRLQLLDYEVYQRRENLRFYGVPEKETEELICKDVLYSFLEEELDVEDAQDIEFQRVHRLGKKRNDGKPRTIIARCLRYTDRESLFSLRYKFEEGSTYGIGQDLPKEVKNMRKALIPKLEEARRQGKKVHFSIREPYRLIIKGEI